MDAFQRRALGAAFLSLLLLAAAFWFQFVEGLAPCPLCIWQRWPHGVAIGLGAALLVLPWRGLALLGVLAMLIGAGIAGYHVGVEQGLFATPAACLGPDITGLPADQALERILEGQPVPCDTVVWQVFGISMAGWNGILSLVLASLWWRAYASSSASQ